ncbi:MAG: ATP-binding protein [Sporichthyaceae bacterium]
MTDPTTDDRRPPVLRRFATMRARITLIATAAVAVILLVSAYGLVTAQGRLLTRGVDEALRQRADNIAPEIVRGGFGTELPGEGDPEDSFLQVIDDQGRVVAATANVQALDPAARPVRTSGRTVIVTVEGVTRTNGQYRVLSRNIGAGRTVVVGKNLDDVNEGVHILTLLLAITIPLVSALLAGLVWWLTGRTLGKVESIRADVASIHGNRLDRRVPVPDTHDEISLLARTMNEMLDRVERATERERRFVADASHELRGPLTRIRSDLELSIAHPAAEDTASLHNALLSDAIALQELVDDLLFLARSESGTLGPRAETIDLEDLVLVEARALRDRGTVLVDTSAVSAARTVGDPRQLTRAIRNLATNAERHARTTVSFASRERAGVSEVVVSDDGPGIAPENRAVAFERFARLDEARSRDAGGTGLGLAIVADIVDRHGGAVTVTSRDGDNSGGTRFVLSFVTAL